jgi:hypothetical protein
MAVGIFTLDTLQRFPVPTLSVSTVSDVRPLPSPGATVWQRVGWSFRLTLYP